MGVVPTAENGKEFFKNNNGLSDPHPNPPHKGEGTFFIKFDFSNLNFNAVNLKITLTQ